MLLVHGEAQRGEARGEARHAQDAYRIFAERRRHMAQHAGLEIRAAAVGIHQRAIRRLRDGIDGQVPPQQVLFQRDVRRELGDEAAVTRPGLALAPRQRMLGLRFRMQEHREIPAPPACSRRA